MHGGARSRSKASERNSSKTISKLICASDTEELSKKLTRGWKAQDCVNLVHAKVEQYALRHGCTVKQLRIPVSLDGSVSNARQEGMSKEMQILNKVIADGEQATKMQPTEAVVHAVVKSGMRDFIDDASEEVTRIAKLSKDGSAGEFSWRAQGSHNDIPGLRRSAEVHCIDDDADGSLIEECGSFVPLTAGNRPAEALDVDFVHDFSTSKTRWTNASSTRECRSGIAEDAWRSRSSLPGFGIRRRDDGIVDVPTAVPENQHRCAIGCRRCYEDVELGLERRVREREPYDDWCGRLKCYVGELNEKRTLARAATAGTLALPPSSPKKRMFASLSTGFDFLGAGRERFGKL